MLGACYGKMSRVTDFDFVMTDVLIMLGLTYLNAKTLFPVCNMDTCRDLRYEGFYEWEYRVKSVGNVTDPYRQCK